RSLRKPTELRAIAAEFNTAQLSFVLRNLAVPDVLDSSLWYDNLEDVERERLKVCEWLLELDELNRDVYKGEIAAINRAASMRELTHKVDSSKIFVDTEAIRRTLPDSFADRVIRCL